MDTWAAWSPWEADWVQQEERAGEGLAGRRRQRDWRQIPWFVVVMGGWSLGGTCA